MPEDNNLFSNETVSSGNFEIIISKSNISITLFGIVGNIMCIIVLFQKQLINRKFNFYLLLLSFSELLFCIIVFLNSLIFYIKPLFAIYDMNTFTCLTTDYIINTTDAYCVFLTLILSIDRLYAIVMPMRSRQFFTNRYPKRVAFVSYIFILILKSPEIFLTQRYYNTIIDSSNITNANNQTEVYYAQTSLCEERNQTKTRKETYVIVCGIVLPLLLHILPALLVLISNGMLLRYVYEYSSKPVEIVSNATVQTRRRSLTVTQKSHHFTIIIMGIWLLMTSIPYYTFNTIFWISRLNIIEESLFIFNYEYVQALFSVLFNSNHSINILIYIIFHKCFRGTFLKLLRINRTDDNALLFRDNKSITINQTSRTLSRKFNANNTISDASSQNSQVVNNFNENDNKILNKNKIQIIIERLCGRSDRSLKNKQLRNDGDNDSIKEKSRKFSYFLRPYSRRRHRSQAKLSKNNNCVKEFNSFNDEQNGCFLLKDSHKQTEKCEKETDHFTEATEAYPLTTKINEIKTNFKPV